MDVRQQQYLEKRNQRFCDAGWTYHYEFESGWIKHHPYDVIIKWCNIHGKAGEDYTFSGPNFWFKDQRFYHWFILRWT